MDATFMTGLAADPVQVGEALNQQFSRPIQSECSLTEFVFDRALTGRGTKNENGTWTWSLAYAGCRVIGGSSPNRIGTLSGVAHAVTICLVWADRNKQDADLPPNQIADRMAAVYRRETDLLPKPDLKRAQWDTLRFTK